MGRTGELKPNDKETNNKKTKFKKNQKTEDDGIKLSVENSPKIKLFVCLHHRGVIYKTKHNINSQNNGQRREKKTPEIQPIKAVTRKQSTER